MPIKMMPYEIASLEVLSEQFSLGEHFVTAFAESLEALAVLFQVVARDTTEYREGRVVILGLLNHAHHNLAGGMKALEAGNAIMWAGCVRELVEIYGAAVLISEKPGKVVNHLGELSAGKLYSAAERGRPGLKADLERLHSIVHPGAGSMYSAFEPVDRSARSVNIEFGLRPVGKEEGREATIILAKSHIVHRKCRAAAG